MTVHIDKHLAELPVGIATTTQLEEAGAKVDVITQPFLNSISWTRKVAKSFDAGSAI